MSQGSFSHPYLANSDRDIQEMLKELNINSIEELFNDIPQSIRTKVKLNIPRYDSEFELYEHIKQVLEKNLTTRELTSFLGGGVLDIYIPAIQDEILRRTEFYSSYTPYQPEITQGMLQALFEYQSMICELTGMNVTNSSMYDWGTAAAEAVLMSARITKRNKILYTAAIAPYRLEILKTYTNGVGLELIEVPYDPSTGKMDTEKTLELLQEDVAGLYFENPNFFGVIEDNIEMVIKKAHEVGTVVIAGVDMSSLGLLEAPGNYGVDIVVGEGQPIGGGALNFGGPLIGIFAMNFDKKWTRQMPGRIVGLTRTANEGERAFVNTLQTREQHIKRERATSNICSNEALVAVSVAIHLALLGPQGLKEIGETMYYNSHYLAEALEKAGFKLKFSSEFFNTLIVELLISRDRKEEFIDFMLERKILPGILHSFDGGETYDLIATTTYLLKKNDLDALVQALKDWRQR